jgi:hypothetical protein
MCNDVQRWRRESEESESGGKFFARFFFVFESEKVLQQLDVKLLLGKFLIANIFCSLLLTSVVCFLLFLGDNTREMSSEELGIFIFDSFGFGVTFF